jgi:RNA-directed DNA polymerase
LPPLRANIFLPHVLEEWVEQEVRPRMQGQGLLSRLADDCVIGCAWAGDARRSMAVLPKRCARFGLRMPPTKTALIACRKPEAHHGIAPGNGTCDLLGLTHDWARARRGFGGIKRRTARTRRWRTKQSVWRWCHIHRHAPLQDQYQQ